ncbi:unnamed protein product [Trifolium pratense]|uniref:Uncharacterized protein n=1 Tax=Trifolium pratense TaxID=57577 RepID=A0ACB0ID25_TRIPR|nr:unnamed protein product [Trifolium pratense]
MPSIKFNDPHLLTNCWFYPSQATKVGIGSFFDGNSGKKKKEKGKKRGKVVSSVCNFSPHFTYLLEDLEQESSYDCIISTLVDGLNGYLEEIHKRLSSVMAHVTLRIPSLYIPRNHNAKITQSM